MSADVIVWIWGNDPQAYPARALSQPNDQFDARQRIRPRAIAPSARDLVTVDGV